MALPNGPRFGAAFTVFNWLYRPLPFLEECAARFGDAFTVRLPSLPAAVVFRHPDAIKDIFSATGDALLAGQFNATLGPFLGDRSVLMLDGPEHLRQRRLMLPPFHGERMQAYGALMIDATNDAIDTWPSDRPFPVHGSMQAITLKVILRAIFGLDQGERYDRMEALLPRLLDTGAWPPLLVPFMRADLGPLSPWGRFLRLSAEADEILYAEIYRRRRLCARGADILSLLLDARDERGMPMSDHELRDELTTLLVAGHETTATSLAWALRWLLEPPSNGAPGPHGEPAQPGVLGRLTEEITRAHPEGSLDPARVAELPLLDAVVRETLRLQPVIPIVGRFLTRPTRVGGWDLPEGALVFASIHLAHRRPEAFPDPSRWDPDRFLGKKGSPYEWLPFGGGIRRCIGMAFALYEMKMVLATVLARASLRLAPGPRPRVVRRSITLTPSGGLPVILERRGPRIEVARPPQTAASAA